MLVQDVDISALTEALSHFNINLLEVVIAKSGGLDLIGRNVNVPEIKWGFLAAELDDLNSVEQGQLLQLDFVLVNSNLFILNGAFQNLDN